MRSKMLDNLRHIDGEHDSPAQVILIKKASVLRSEVDEQRTPARHSGRLAA
jgi:hypothetical protein